MVVRKFILLLLLPLIWMEIEAVGSSYTEELINHAHELKLAQSKQWQKLLFFTPKWFKESQSFISSPKFFLDEDGRYDASLELDATIKAFFNPDMDSDKEGMSQHPQCQFPARFFWLNKQLNFDPIKLKFVECKLLKDLLADLDADRVSFVFSSGYLNNPASMFGHTFLRLHKRPTHGTSQAMLDYAINFAAYPTTKHPLLYPIMGVSGLFAGYFDLLPFFMKVQEYNAAENRDLWEYELTLTPEQTQLMLLSVFEVGRHRINYFYLDDNCALFMLVLLEVANPELDLTSHYSFWVIPIDTVKTVAQAPGLVKAMHFRPSNFYKYLARYKTLNDEEANLVKRVVDLDEKEPAKNLLGGLAPRSQARIIDTALDFIDFKEKLVEDNKPVKYASLRGPLLAMRAATPVVSDSVDEVPLQKEPSLGHNSTRIGLANGAGTKYGQFTRLEWRPALHDVGAVALGYSDELEIRFMDADLQYNWRDRNLYVSDFRLMEVLSLAPWRPLLRPTSWRLSFGMETECATSDADRCRRFYIQSGAGLSFKPFSDHHTFYMMGLLDVGSANNEGQGLHAGLGYQAGYIWAMSDHWKMALKHSVLYRYGGRSLWDPRFRSEMSYLFPGDFELRGSVFLFQPEQQYFLSLAKYL